MLDNFSSATKVVTVLILIHSAKSLTDFTQLPEPTFLLQKYDLGRTAKHIPTPKVHRCGEVGKDPVVNFVNANYPHDDTTAGDCKLRMVITNQHICQIRVDFVDTELMDPVRGECLSQFFIVQGLVWPTGLPPLCGINNDQHFYLHLEPWTANSTVVDFNVVTVVRGRPFRFGMWLTQIDCSSPNVLKAPEGCTQYFLAENGTIKSFNYEGYRYLNAQNYQSCIRPLKGACGIQYSAPPGDFSLKKSNHINKDILQRSGSGVGTAVCGTDYVLIPEGRGSRESTRRERLLFNRRRRPVTAPPAPAPLPKRKKLRVVPSVDRFCGVNFAPTSGEKSSTSIFAPVRSNLIQLRVKTTPLQEERGNIEALNLTTGFRLIYKQITICTSKEPDLAVFKPIETILEALQWTSDGGMYLKEPNVKSPDLKANASSISSASSEVSDDDDTMWDYLDMHTEDRETEEKDLYDM